MNLSHADLAALTDLAIRGAIRAGDLIASYKDRNLPSYDKSKDGSPVPLVQYDDIFPAQIVTEADFKSQEIIVDTLLPTLHDYDLGLLAEESDDDGSRFDKDYFWSIDPLDGTLQFAEGKDGYSIAIALIDRQGEPLIGVVLDPARNILYHAAKGFGAFRNDLPFNLSSDDHDHSVSLIYDRSFGKQFICEALIEALRIMSINLGYAGFNAHEFGGSVMNAVRVLEENPAVFFKLPQTRPGGGCIWDFAPTACIYTEMGAYATDIFGKPLHLNGRKTCYLNHCGVIYTGSKGVQESICSLHKELQDSFEQNISIAG